MQREGEHYAEYINKLRYVRFVNDYTRAELLLDLAACDMRKLYDHLPKGAMSTSMLCLYVDRIAHGLQRMHERGVVHRDLKMENIFIGLQEPYWPVIADMGLAIQLRMDSGGKLVPEGSRDRLNDTANSERPYISPEAMKTAVCQLCCYIVTSII